MVKRQKLTEKEKLELKLFWIGVGGAFVILTTLSCLLAIYIAKFGFGWF